MKKVDEKGLTSPINYGIMDLSKRDRKEVNIMCEKTQLQNQLQALAENTATEFMDAYQCMDWGITPRQFAKKLIKKINEMVMEYAKEMESDEE